MIITITMNIFNKSNDVNYNYDANNNNDNNERIYSSVFFHNEF